MRTILFNRIAASGILLLAATFFSGCGQKETSRFATITLKRDGSHFSGKVARREAKSITLIGPEGDIRTFLDAELSGPVQYGSADAPPAAQQPSAQSASGSSSVSSQGESQARSGGSTPIHVSAVFAAGGNIEFPAGTDFPVRITGFLDSCCLPPGTITLGRTDSELRAPGGKVAVPVGSNVVFEILTTERIDGRRTMVFQLSSADFGGQHYIIDPGATVTFTGAKSGTPEAKARGENVHLQDQTFMGFKTSKPVIFRLSR